MGPNLPSLWNDAVMQALSIDLVSDRKI
jgi:hypothetical protein